MPIAESEGDRLLASSLERHREALLASWGEQVLGLPESHYRQRPPHEVRSWLQRGLTVLMESLEDGSPSPLEAHAREMARTRQQLGFEINEVIDALLRIKGAALPFVYLDLQSDPAELMAAVASLDRHLGLMVASFAALFADAMRAQQQRVTMFEERQRLARDLHDSVSQSLYAVNMYAEALVRVLAAGQTARAAEHVAELKKSASQALREMRLLVFELRPSSLPSEGLVAAVRARLAAVEGRAGTRTKLTVDHVERLPHHYEEELHGIAREALNNSLKHASARNLSVTLCRVGQQLLMTIEDDGTGFEPEEGLQKGGLGLRGMRERVARLNGTLHIDSQVGQGTSIRVEVPWPTADPVAISSPQHDGLRT